MDIVLKVTCVCVSCFCRFSHLYIPVIKRLPLSHDSGINLVMSLAYQYCISQHGNIASGYPRIGYRDQSIQAQDTVPFCVLFYGHLG